MKSPVIKRSIVIAGHKTSVSLEDAFWKGLKEIAVSQHTTLSDLVASIDTERPHGNLSSAIRLFVLDHYQARINGHAASGHDTGAHSESGLVPGSHTLGGHGVKEHAGNGHAEPREMLVAASAGPSVLRPE
jgi:predicted DNA-binding ribbon-helix-helix protein